MDLVFLSTATWNSDLWTNKQHLAERLGARGHRVLFVESLNLRRPRLTLQDAGTVARRLGQALKSKRQPAPGVTLVHPLAYTGSGSRAIRELSLYNVLRVVKRRMRALRFESPTLWLYNPVAISLSRRYGWRRIVYHCVDDLAAVPGIRPDVIKASEARVAAEADLVLCSSEPLFRAWTERTAHARYLPNVADIDLFAGATPEPDILAERKRQNEELVLLYYGSLSSYKVDFDLLSAVAMQRPRWGIWLVGVIGEGEAATKLGRIGNLPNVHIRPAVSPVRLARIVAAADVCILPHVRNQYTRASFPMKFFECLAAGKPVVGRGLESLNQFRHLYTVAESSGEFVEAIEHVVKNDNPVLMRTRKIAASAHGWNERTLEIERLLAF